MFINPKIEFQKCTTLHEEFRQSRKSRGSPVTWRKPWGTPRSGVVHQAGGAASGDGNPALFIHHSSRESRGAKGRNKYPSASVLGRSTVERRPLPSAPCWRARGTRRGPSWFGVCCSWVSPHPLVSAGALSPLAACTASCSDPECPLGGFFAAAPPARGACVPSQGLPGVPARCSTCTGP